MPRDAGPWPGIIAVAVLALAFAIAPVVAAAEASASNPGFSIQPQGETFWLTRPNGERFFSLGVCCVSQGPSRTDFDASNPAYAAWRNYDDSKSWAEAT